MTITPVAVLGPSFHTVMVYVRLVPTTTVGLSATFMRRRSARAVTATLLWQVEEQPLAFVTVTLSSAVPALPADQVMSGVFCPAVIVPPKIVQA